MTNELRRYFNELKFLVGDKLNPTEKELYKAKLLEYEKQIAVGIDIKDDIAKTIFELKNKMGYKI